jgi:hypothetical protein
MAVPNDDPIPWDSLNSWFDNYLEGLDWDAANLEDIRWDEVFTSGDPNFHGLSDEPTPDAAPQTHTTDLQHNHLVLDGKDYIYDIPSLDDIPNPGDIQNPDDIRNQDDITNLHDIPGLDDIPNPDLIMDFRDIMTLDHSQTEPALTTALTSPSSSGDITQTPSSGDFNFNSSPGLWEIPYLSPNSLMEQSPQAYFAVPHRPIINAGVPHFVTGQLNSSPCMGDGIAPKALTTAPTSSIHQSLAQTATEPRQLTMEDRPPGISSREWRKIIKPEKCPKCPMGFPYKHDLNKHIVARHRQIAAKRKLSLERHACKWCPGMFARKDHLKRHLTKEHQREKTWKRRSKG